MEYNKRYQYANREKPLAKTLRQLRLNAGFTQQNIADALNINRSTYTYYETGKTTPDIHTLKVLARVFDVPIDAFLVDQPIKSLSDFEGKRPKKTVQQDPQKIGELSSEEKSVIALLRSFGPETDLNDTIDELKKKLEQSNQP